MHRLILRSLVFTFCMFLGTVSVLIHRSLNSLQSTRTRSQSVNEIITLDESDAVYQAVLSQSFAEAGVKLLVVQEETVRYPISEDLISEGDSSDGTLFADSLNQTLHQADRFAIENFAERNRTVGKITVRPDAQIKYVLVSKAEVDAMFPADTQGGGWRSFYARYPHSSGLIVFSKVGFNATHTQAMLYAGRTCGGLCGSGNYLLLNKEKGKWVVKAEQPLWIS